MGFFSGKNDKDKKPKDIYKEELKAGGRPIAFDVVKYLGGHPSVIVNNIEGNITVNSKGIFFDQIFTNNFFAINTENIITAEFKTDEQISKDVTLTRMLALGVFAFAFKKKTKEVNSYLIVKFHEEGIENTAILQSKKAGSLASAIMKLKQDFAKENPLTGSSTIKSNTLDIADQIRKLAELRDSNLLTEEEFQNQKAKLLNM